MVRHCSGLFRCWFHLLHSSSTSSSFASRLANIQPSQVPHGSWGPCQHPSPHPCNSPTRWPKEIAAGSTQPRGWQKLTTDFFFLSAFVRHWIHLYFWFQASSLAASLLSSFSLLILASLSFVRTLYFILYAHKWVILKWELMRLFSMLYLLNDHLPYIVQ